MMRITNSERDAVAVGGHASTHQGPGVRVRSRPHLHYLDPEPQTPPAWLGIGLALLLVGCIAVVAWTAIVVVGAMGAMR